MNVLNAGSYSPQIAKVSFEAMDMSTARAVLSFPAPDVPTTFDFYQVRVDSIGDCPGVMTLNIQDRQRMC